MALVFAGGILCGVCLTLMAATTAVGALLLRELAECEPHTREQLYRAPTDEEIQAEFDALVAKHFKGRL